MGRFEIVPGTIPKSTFIGKMRLGTIWSQNHPPGIHRKFLIRKKLVPEMTHVPHDKGGHKWVQI